MVESFWEKEDLKNSQEQSQEQKETTKLKNTVLSGEDVLATAYREWGAVDFWYNTAFIPGHFKEIKNKILEKFKDIDSSTAILLKNPQIQIFLSRIISNYEGNWNEIKSKNIENKRNSINSDDALMDKNKEINSKDSVENWENNELDDLHYETWEEYKAHALDPESFENFLLSDEWISILKNEISTHIDGNWNIYKNYRISETNLRIKLNQAWHNSIYRDYNLKFNKIANDNIIEINRIWNIVTNVIDSAVWNHLRQTWDKFNRSLIEWIESWLTNETNNVYIKKINEDQEFKDIFYDFLKENIKKYYNLVIKNNTVSLDTKDKQVDLQLRSYIYIYGRYFHPDMVKPNQSESYYENNLLRIMKAILVFDGKIKDMEDSELVARERRAAEERKKREEERRKRREEEVRKKNKEINNQKRVYDQRTEFTKPLDKKPTNLTDATWAEIAASADLWEDSDNYNFDVNNIEQKKLLLEQIAFDKAWDDFISSHSNVSEIITKKQMLRIFDFKNNIINISEWEIFKKNNPIFKWKSDEFINSIYGTLSNFSSIFSENITKISEESSNKKSEFSKTVKNHAIGTVIDNIRDTLAVIDNKQNWSFKWFELNDKKPIERKWNIIVISWFRNGSDVEISYNLDTWWLFIKSSFYRLEPNKLAIWDNLLVPIWEIKPFNQILNGYHKNSDTTRIYKNENHTKSMWIWANEQGYKTKYHVPQSPNNWSNNANLVSPNDKQKSIRNLLLSQFDLIEDNVKDRLEKQVVRNSTIKQFFRTFNIIADSWEITTIHINDTSNLFKFIEIIERTGEDENNGIWALEYFNNGFMPTIMKYSWLEWWKNNMSQNKGNEYSKRVFNNPDANDDIKCLNSKIGHFKSDQFSGTRDFDSNHQLDFINLIIEKLLDTNTKSKLDIGKMEDFITSIETNISSKKENPV